MELEELTVKELQEKLIEMGMPEDDVTAFRTKAPLIATIRTLQAKEVVETQTPAEKAAEGVIKRVATIEERPNPAEDRQVNRRFIEKANVMKRKLLEMPTVRILIPTEPSEKRGEVIWVYTQTGERMNDDEWNALPIDQKMATHQERIEGDVESVQLNGYRYIIPKGKYTPVPLQVAEVISNSQQQTLDAGKDMSLERIDPKTGRPMNEVL